MPAYRLPSAHDRTPLQRRASGLALALAFNLLLLFVLLGIGAFRPEPPKPQSRALVVDLIPESHSAPAQPRAAAKPPPRRPRPVPPRPPNVLPVTPPIPAAHPLEIIPMSSDELSAADIGKISKDAEGTASAGDSEEVGRGPHGEVLYAAEWAREPTDAELGGYLPANAPDGYGLIACKTIPGNRVDDCVELDNSPRGSHLASAVRQAAWQFRVRPPRKNGRTLVGEWVRIRIDYIHSGKGE